VASRGAGPGPGRAAVTWRIRPATVDDVPALQAVEIDAGRRFVAIGLDEIAGDDPLPDELLAAHVDAGTAWVAVEGERIVGYAIASVVDGAAHLDQISVAGDAGGRGIGRELVERVAAWARAAGRQHLTLTTFRDVPWNAPLYRRLGFTDLADAELTGDLGELRAGERRRGLDAHGPRLAMRRVL